MNYNGHRNIEEWFLNAPLDSFPHGTDYPAIYRGVKNILEKQVHSEIKAVALSYLEEEYLNDHGVSHINTVIKRASDLLEKADYSLTPYQTFLLLMGIQLHDAGHIIAGRNGHRDNVTPIIHRVINPLLLQTSEKQIIKKIIRAHSGKDDPIRILPNNTHFSETYYPQVLAAIIRISDELADDCLRASTFLLDIGSDRINEHSKIFHLYSKCLDSCRIFANAHEIEQIFVLNKEIVRNPIEIVDGEIFMIDQIYNNSKKTFTECLYCNRFLPPQLRINRLTITVYFIDSEQLEDFMDPIEYRLEENGYPVLSWDSIFEACSETLCKEGVRMDGVYLKEKLESDEKKPV